MLGVPPLPWLGVVGRPGEAKGIAIWFAKQVIMELQKRRQGGVVSDDESGGEAADKHVPADKQIADDVPQAAEPPQKQANKCLKRGPRHLADMGTLYGFLQQTSKNEERAFIASHEIKKFIGKLLNDSPGFDAHSLNKLYDKGRCELLL